MRWTSAYVRVVLLSVVALCWTGARADGPGDADVVHLLAEAQSQLDDDKPQAAIITLSNAARDAPESVEVRHLLATTSLELGDAERAEKEIRRAIDLGLEPTTAWPLLVKSIFAQYDMRRVIDEALLMPLDLELEARAEILAMRGYAELASGDRKRGEKTLRSALAIEQDTLYGLLGMAVLESRRGSLDDGRDLIERALEAHPTSPEAWALLGDVRLASGDYVAAVKSYDEAIDLRQYTGIEHARRALALTQLERYDEAADDLAALSASKLQSHSYVQYVAGRLAFAQGRLQQAAEAFDQSYSADPTLLANRLYLAITHVLLGQPEQALVHAQFFASRTSRLAAPSPGGVGLVSVEQMRTPVVDASQYMVAKRALLRAAEDDPEDATVVRLLAGVAAAQGDDAARRAYTQQLRELEASAPDARAVAALAEPPAGADGASDDSIQDLLPALKLFQDGDLDGALQAAQALVDADPTRTAPLNLVSAVHLASGRWDEGKRSLGHSLALDPNQPAVVRNLAAVEATIGSPERARELLRGLRLDQLGAGAVLQLYRLEAQLADRDAGLGLLRSALRSYPEATEIRAQLAAEAMAENDAPAVLELTDSVPAAEFDAVPSLYELRGQAQLMSGDAGAAAATFRDWTQAHPESARAHFLWADVLARSGNAETAHAAIDLAVELEPASLPARIGRVKSLVYRDELQEAAVAIDALKQDFGDTPEVLGIEGWYAVGVGDYDRARTALGAFLEQRTDSEIVQLLVRALWAQQAHEEALAVMQHHLEQAPQDLVVFRQLAEAYLALERGEEAEAAYERILAVYPDDIVALNNLALLKQDDPEQALAFARRAYELSPEDPRVLETLGEVLVRSGHAKLGSTMLRDAAQRQLDDAALQLRVGRALLELGHRQEARKVLVRLVEHDPATPEAEQAQLILTGIEDL